LKVILALGNPGKRYRDTRHNVGWWLADRLARAWSLPAFRAVGRAARAGSLVEGAAVELIKPLTYVNRSGEVVRRLLEESAIEAERDLLVLVDDVSLSPGTLRLRARGSPGGHNGLASIETALNSDVYGRLRIGVGRPHDDRISLADWVLAPMTPRDEERVVATFGDAVAAIECWIGQGVEPAMNRVN
jgi:PTH1 family peptidyl-tRNA hydrolase